MNIFKLILSHVQRAKTFRQTLKGWFGEGAHPVPASVAQKRANQCCACNFNVRRSTGSEILPALVVRRVEAKNKLKLSVEGEWQLRTCHLCSCYLPLKVQIPILHLRQHMRQEVVDAIHEGKPDCWQIMEQVP
jgi:hypothetical protein